MARRRGDWPQPVLLMVLCSLFFVRVISFAVWVIAMLCFEVYQNGEKVCTAGLGDEGVLTAILTWVSHRPEVIAARAAQGIPDNEPVEMFFRVGGLDSVSDEHLEWLHAEVQIGDEIRIRVVERSAGDTPSRRNREDPAKVEEQKRKYVRKIAKELGWEIITNPTNSPEHGTPSTPE